MSFLHRFWIRTIAGLALLGCVGPVKHEMRTDFPAAVHHVVKTPPVMDGRTRFREIFCRMLAEESEGETTAGDCERFLLRLGDEPLPQKAPRPIPGLGKRFRVLVVPGFLNECFATIAFPFEDVIPSLEERGIAIQLVMVGGRSSSQANAVYLAETIENLDLAPDERLVLVGHSKGVVDILHMLVDHPHSSRRVAAVIGVAGAVNGSPLADQLAEIYFNLARNALSGRCETGDDGALEDLKPAMRLAWLADHTLPPSVRYFSVATCTRRENINTLLKAGYDRLWIVSPRNDGLLLTADQVIPGGTLLGYVDADHWSVVLPLENKSLLISETVQAPEAFPRNVLLEALLVYVAEALETGLESP